MTVHALRPHDDLATATPPSAEVIPSADGAPVIDQAQVHAQLQAQMELIDAFWDDVEERVAYLIPLLSAGRHNEALSLCAIYLEGVAHALVAAGGADGSSFTDEVEEHASDPFLALVHPLQLVRVAAQLNGLSPSAAHGLAARFAGPEQTLLHKSDAVEIIRATLAGSDAHFIERALWKCTLAYVVYDFVSNQSFRRREGGSSVGLGSAFRAGSTMQGLSVPELVSLMGAMIAEARRRSQALGRLP